MKLFKLIQVSIAVFAALAGLNIGFSLLTSAANDERARAYMISQDFVLAGRDLRIASLELTRLTRSFIVMGMEPQLDQYWYELLYLDKLGIIRQRFVDIGISPHEMELLDRALAYQEMLRSLDAAAIDARFAGDYELALYITYSSSYTILGVSFVDALDALNDATLARTREMVDRAERRAIAFGNLTFVTAVFFGIVIVVGTVFILREVKATMGRERDARESERDANVLNQMYLDACPMFTEIWDDKQNLIDCNEKTREFFGLSDKGEFLNRYGELSPEFQPCGTRSTEKARAMAARALKDGSTRVEWLHKGLDGELMPVDTTLVRLKRDGRDVIIGYNYDLRQVKAAEGLTKKLLDNSPMFMEFWDTEGNLRDCNKRILEIFGVSDKAELRKRFFDFCPELQPCGTPSREKNDQMIANAMRKGVYRSEWMFVMPCGEELPTEATWVRIAHQGEPMIIVYSQDLRIVKASIKKEQQAEEENLAKTRFLAHMSHEIRTPMNAVQGIAEIYLQKDGYPPEIEDAFLRIHNASRLLLNIVNDILDLSRVVAGKMEIIPAKYGVANLIADTIQLNHMHIGGKNLEMRFDVDWRLPASLVGDELRIKQILNNLLSNAIKYTTEGSVTMSVGMEPLGQPSDEPDELSLVIAVSDTGQGMTREEIDELFAEFSRFNTRTNRNVEGSGLGMAITYSLIKLMNGDIDVKSELGKGSSFIVRLPQKSCNAEILGRETALNLRNTETYNAALKRKPRRRTEHMPYGRVLVVDDVDINLFVVQGILDSYGISAETATSGAEAVARIGSGETYDIIFMDHMMPGMDGVEATRAIRDMGYDRPIVALTANALKDTERMFMENGFSGFVSKPIDVDKLDTYLTRFVRDGRPQESPRPRGSTEAAKSRKTVRP